MADTDTFSTLISVDMSWSILSRCNSLLARVFTRFLLGFLVLRKSLRLKTLAPPKRSNSSYRFNNRTEVLACNTIRPTLKWGNLHRSTNSVHRPGNYFRVLVRRANFSIKTKSPVFKKYWIVVQSSQTGQLFFVNLYFQCVIFKILETLIRRPEKWPRLPRKEINVIRDCCNVSLKFSLSFLGLASKLQNHPHCPGGYSLV